MRVVPARLAGKLGTAASGLSVFTLSRFRQMAVANAKHTSDIYRLLAVIVLQVMSAVPKTITDRRAPLAMLAERLDQRLSAQVAALSDTSAPRSL